eukprot:m.14057 g.14057  ORF g.14057 m.14057 type:complete len:104 (+) comp25453_c0_seq1:730-1041(+)
MLRQRTANVDLETVRSSSGPLHESGDRLPSWIKHWWRQFDSKYPSTTMTSQWVCAQVVDFNNYGSGAQCSDIISEKVMVKEVRSPLPPRRRIVHCLHSGIDLP